jgi:hypothetical protein
VAGTVLSRTRENNFNQGGKWARDISRYIATMPFQGMPLPAPHNKAGEFPKYEVSNAVPANMEETAKVSSSAARATTPQSSD